MRIEREPEPAGKPLGYAKQVQRMKKFHEEKYLAEKKMEREVTGNRYKKEKLERVKPPSFLESN